MILVTGATGLVGSHLLYKLTSEGNDVVAISRNLNNIKKVKSLFNYYSAISHDLFSKISWIEGDITDKVFVFNILRGIKKVYHCAADVRFAKTAKKEILATNIKGTTYIVDACLENNIEKLCYVSSIATLGRNKNVLPTDESCIWDSSQKHSIYALSKFHAEMEVWRGIEEGLQAVIVNPSIIIGPADWNTSSMAIFKSIKNGLPFYPPGTTGFVDARDVADIMIQLMNSNVSGKRFILNSQNLSYYDFFNLIAKHLNTSPPQFRLSKNIAYIGIFLSQILSLLTGKKPMLSKEIIHSVFTNEQFSAESIKNLLQYNFISVENAIENACRYLCSDKRYS